MPKPPFPTGKNKYHAVPTAFKGVKYASKSEAAWARHLDGEVESGDVVEVVNQPKFRLGCPENVYVADFLVIPDDEVKLADDAGCDRLFSAFVDDVKGVETPKFKRDLKLWKAYGRLPLRIIKRGKVSRVVVPDRYQGE